MRRCRAFRLIICLLGMILFFACGKVADKPSETALPPLTETDLPTAAPQETPLPPETVVLYGREISADVEWLEFTEPVDDLLPLFDALTRFPDCRSVQIIRNYDPEKTENGLAAFERDWELLSEQFPNVAFSGQLLIGGEPSETLTSYTVPAAASLSEEIPAVVSLCPALQTLDLSETAASSEAVAKAEQDAPGVRILWTDAVYGASSSDAETLAFSGEQDADALLSYLACFPALSVIDVRDTTLSEEQGDALSDRFPSAAVRRTVTLNGKPFDSFTEEIDLSGAKIASCEAFSDSLRYFPKLRQLLMHDCSLSNEELASIRDRYPNVKVVWTVRFSRWHVSTDAIAFSTMQSGYTKNRMKTKDVQVLRYCRDLIALDLGHNAITDIEWIRELPDLQVLILANNWDIVDLTPIGSLTKLKYLELFMCHCADISPLANLSELLDVNLVITRVTDISPLLQCKKLERIWLGEKVAAQIGKEGILQLQKAFPNAEFDLVSAGSTSRGWRDHPRYEAYMTMFKTNQPVEPFLP